MKIFYVTVFLFACFCNIFASNSASFNNSQRPLSALALDSRNFALLTEIFNRGNQQEMLLYSIERAVYTNNLEAITFLFNHFDYQPDFGLAQEVASVAIKHYRADALHLALQRMNPFADMTELMTMAFTYSNCPAVKIINRWITNHPNSFRPVDEFPTLSWEVAKADNFDVFRELLDSDFFLDPFASRSSPFEYQEITEDEFLSLLSCIRADHWTHQRHHVAMAYSKALNRGFLRALRFILGRFSLRRYHQTNPNGFDGSLRLLIRDNSISVLGLLLESHVHVNHTLYFRSPQSLHRLLDHAVMWSNPETIRFLLERGAEINHLDHNGSNSAIVQAILSGRTDIYQMLVNAGAVPLLTNITRQELVKNIDMNTPSNQRSLLLAATREEIMYVD